MKWKYQSRKDRKLRSADGYEHEGENYDSLEGDLDQASSQSLDHYDQETRKAEEARIAEGCKYLSQGLKEHDPQMIQRGLDALDFPTSQNIDEFELWQDPRLFRFCPEIFCDDLHASIARVLWE